MTKTSSNTSHTNMRVALVVPHIFMHRDILPTVIFSPGHLALALAAELQVQNVVVTLFTPGPVSTTVPNIVADLNLFENELTGRGDSYIDLLRKHPFTFITLARQVQSELVARAYAAANNDEYDLVHIYTNEEELALPFAKLCNKPVVFTHHDPFNFLVKYKSNFPKYKELNWLSMSLAQRKGMPTDTNWVGNIYHGLDDPELYPVASPTNDYVAFLGRIIEPKGLHLAIAAVKHYNKSAATPLTLKIAGKHYADASKDRYWQEVIEPALGENIEYIGFINDSKHKREFIGNAQSLLVPSLFEEPFGMVCIEAFACGTPVIALGSGALPEVVQHRKTGLVVSKKTGSDGKVNEYAATHDLAESLQDITSIRRVDCRDAYEKRFTVETMARNHKNAYLSLIDSEPDKRSI